MTADRCALIRHKNEVFDRLVNADRICRRRRHTAGDVPATWLAQLEELRREYEEWIMQLRTQVREQLRAAGITTLRPSMDATDADWQQWMEAFDGATPDNPLRYCPKCGGRLVEKRGKHGRFLGCENYAALGCKHTASV